MSMNERCEPHSIEPRCQKRWEEAGAFRAGRSPCEPRYVLEMFPYPSGAMHMGHGRVYTIGDAIARYLRMRGYDVMHPIGFDALGLPAENAAIKDGRHPAERTRENIVAFRAELKKLGFSFDWDREIVTADPEYYRWNQWFFLRMLERGIVYRREGKANWCTGCNTVIANEQVVDDNRCERCESPVVEKVIPEWAFRITAFAQDLLDGLETLTEWPERITTMQRNWIGKSVGAEVAFAVPGQPPIDVFTTRVDTIFGCTYVVLAPEHPLVERVTIPERRDEVRAFVERMRKTDANERTGEGAPKEGVFTGAFAVNPYDGEQVPVWIANFVLAEYGTGAVMSVPAHDQRDFEFAKKYGLPIRVVIQPAKGERLSPGDALAQAFTEDGVVEASGRFTGLPSPKAREVMAEEARAKGFGKPTVRWHLRDWGFSRQRYWGTPIPVVYCETDVIVPVPDSQLPVVLPEEAIITGKGEPPLAKVPAFVNTTCPKCGKRARREVETMDTFVDSSWYYARYLSPHDDRRPFEPEAAKRWLPIDIYVGGPEHAVMHLLYFRFWHRVMHQLGLVHEDELFRFLARVWRIFHARQECFGVAALGARRAQGQPDEAAPERAGGPGGAVPPGMSVEFLELRRRTHRTIQRVTEGFEKELKFNTGIAALMELVNALYQLEPRTTPERAAVREALVALATLLAPFAPHVAEELWHEVLGPAVRDRLLADEPWPAFDPALVVAGTVTIAVQVNGKLRGEVQAPAAAAEADVRALAEAEERVKAHLEGKTVRKVVFVPKRLINFVVG